jgi:hypothetical protein
MSYVFVSSLAALAAAGYGFARRHSQARLAFEPDELLARSRQRLNEAFAGLADLEPRLTAGDAAFRREAGQARESLQELGGALDLLGSGEETLLADPELRRLLVDLYEGIDSGATTIHRLRQQVHREHDH